MAVYVDDAAIQAQVGRYRSRWSHLTADSREELHAFAEQLGLRREWFQPGNKSGLAKPGSFSAEAWHYDVTANKRLQAIRLGAQSVTSAEMNEVIMARSPATLARRSLAADDRATPTGAVDSRPTDQREDRVTIQLGATATKANEVRKALETQRDQQLRANRDIPPEAARTAETQTQTDELEGVLADAAIAGAEAITRKLKDYGSFKVTATIGQDPADPNGLAGVSVSVNAIP